MDGKYVDDDDNEAWDEDPEIEHSATVKTVLYEIKELKEVEKILEESIKNVMELLGVNNDQAVSILKYFKWNISKIEAKWFTDTTHYGKLCGIVHDPSIMKQNEKKCILEFDPNCTECMVCSETFTKDNPGAALDCGHRFCDECWKGVCKAAITKGKEGIFSRCPFLKCYMQISRSFFKKYCTSEDFDKYMIYLCKSYTDENPHIKWCTAPGCNYFTSSEFGFPEIITCKCGNSFCSFCGSEPHKPIDCDMAKKWTDKNTKDGENVLWLSANTKPCPNCKAHIEKNGGCFYMRCIKCSHEFCWSCLHPWSEHSDHWVCNLYKKELEQNKKLKKMLADSQDAAEELRRFGFYYQKYYAHNQGQTFAKKELDNIEIVKNDYMSRIVISRDDLHFLDEAVISVLEMRRILKYSYVYGYYKYMAKGKELFQYQQGLLEHYCDMLHLLIEKGIDMNIDEKLDINTFSEYKSKVIGYYGSCQNYYNAFCKSCEGT